SLFVRGAPTRLCPPPVLLAEQFRVLLQHGPPEPAGVAREAAGPADGVFALPHVDEVFRIVQVLGRPASFRAGRLRIRSGAASAAPVVGLIVSVSVRHVSVSCGAKAGVRSSPVMRKWAADPSRNTEANTERR